jgi:hypothetical protein
VASGGILSTTEQLDPSELEEPTEPTVSVTPLENSSVSSPASELVVGKNEDEEMLPVL